MKQYTDAVQTVRLIDLGFPAPKSVSRLSLDLDMDTIPTFAYSIGELIEMLPKTIESEIWVGEDKGKIGVWGLLIDTAATEYGWDISYDREFSAYLYREGASELIDALFEMVIKLKEEEII